METFFGIPLVHSDHLMHLLVRFAIDMVAVLVLIGALYYPSFLALSVAAAILFFRPRH